MDIDPKTNSNRKNIDRFDLLLRFEHRSRHDKICGNIHYSLLQWKQNGKIIISKQKMVKAV